MQAQPGVLFVRALNINIFNISTNINDELHSSLNIDLAKNGLAYGNFHPGRRMTLSNCFFLGLGQTQKNVRRKVCESKVPSSLAWDTIWEITLYTLPYTGKQSTKVNRPLACVLFPIVSGLLPDSKALCRQLQVFLYHHSLKQFKK